MINREQLSRGSDPMPARFLLVAGFAALGSHIAWATHLSISYFLVQPVCQTGGEFALHMASIGMLLVSLGSLAVAVRFLRRNHAPFSRNIEGFDGWKAFIGLFGIVSGLLFSLAIVAQWVPMFLVDACV